MDWWWKVLLTPALLALATLVGRRFGDRASGWMAGLPLTSGPISVFLALQQGSHFAARAAIGTLLGWIAVTGFCVAYSRAARSLDWIASSTLALAAFLGAAWLLRELSPALLPAFVLAFASPSLALRAVGSARGNGARSPAPRWDLAFRMVVATALVLVVTGFAATLGPTLSGMLSPFPVFAGTLAVFAHVQRGSAAATEILRGVLAGGYAFASFFAVVAVGLEPMGALATYPLAAGAAIGVGGVALTALHRPARGRAPHAAA